MTNYHADHEVADLRVELDLMTRERNQQERFKWKANKRAERYRRALEDIANDREVNGEYTRRKARKALQPHDDPEMVVA